MQVVYTVTSPLSAFMASLHALEHHKSDDCFLLLDPGKRKQTFIAKIIEGGNKMQWKSVIDFSEPIDDEINLKPSSRKKITRKFKDATLIKPFYSILLRRYKKKLIDKYSILLEKAGIIDSPGTCFYSYHQTVMMDVIRDRYKQSRLNYFEHGLGDYMYWHEFHADLPFYCFFANSYATYLKEKEPASVYTILPVGKSSEMRWDAPANQTERDTALWILQPLDVYQVSDNCWKNYTQKVVEICKMNNCQKIILKCHPLQSNTSITIITEELKKSTLEIVSDQSQQFHQNAIEFIFPQIQSGINSVISLFSSSVCYLSQLYPNPEIKYYSSYSFLENYLENAPAQFKNPYLWQKELFEKVYSKNCIKF